MIGTVYDYYLTTYANKPVTRSDTHKKSELRNIYNNIVKISKSSPLYKIDVSADVQKYAIDLKENARSLMNDIDSLVFDRSTSSQAKYSADDEEAVSINTLSDSAMPDISEAAERDSDDNSGNRIDNDNSVSTLSGIPVDMGNDNFTLEVQSLATPQTNTGYYLRDDSLNISRGDHTFEVAIDNNVYEFQFKVNENDTNRSVIDKLARLVNRSGIGLNANVLRVGGTSALEISSKTTGATFKSEIFSISGSSTNDSDNVVEQLGIGSISSYPSNAKFTLNGIDKTSSSNTFTINKSIEVTLNSPTNGKAINISKRDDLDAVLESVNNLIDGYNRIIELSGSKSEKDSSDYDSAFLNHEMRRTASAYRNELEAIGLTMNDDGSLKLDNALFLQTATEDSIENTLGKLTDFKNSLSTKSHDISINPMKYVNKTMISYPHPIKTKNFANPYVTSIYTGMMYNGYV